MLENKAEFASRRVVIVDDNRNFRELLRAMLRTFGFRRVDMFGDASEAAPFFAQNHIDLMFVDLVVPDMDGLTLARAIRTDAAVLNRLMPIVLITGHASRGTVMQSLAAGIDDVVVKPASPKTVFDRARSLIGRPPRYVAGSGGYLGPDIAARWQAMSARPENDAWRMSRTGRPGQVRRAAPERRTALPAPQPRSAGLPGMGVAVRNQDDDAFILD